MSNNHTDDLNHFSQDFRQSILSHVESEEEGTFEESAFVKLITDYMTEAGEIEDVDVCLHRAIYKTRGIQTCGYCLSENGESLDVLVAIHTGCVPPETVGKGDVDSAFKRAMEFYNQSTKGYHADIEESGCVFDAAQQIYNASRNGLSRIRFILLTDGIVKAAPPVDKDMPGYRANFEIWDIERLFRLVSSGREREVIEIDFDEILGTPIQCLVQPTQTPDYNAYLAIFPGEALAALYGKYGARLLERNVRSFLQSRNKINSGMRETIRKDPHMFLAFNNGLSVTAEKVDVVDMPCGGKGIRKIRDLQIVNGGQTTASIYHAVKRDKADVADLYVQVKLTVLTDLEKMDEIVPLISRYANSQNKILEADLAANDVFHRTLEGLSRTIWAPAKENSPRQTRWFYERARAQYQDEITRAGTKAKIRDFEIAHPKSQLFTKTDLAKAAVTWNMRPDMVSKGAQACFLWFMNNLDEHLNSEGQVDQTYFERLVAKIIIFRSADALIKDKKMGYTGYWANIVTYTIARLVHETGGWIDLGRIWKDQKLSPVLEEAIRDISRATNAYITNPTGQANVTQFCKMLRCWEGFKGTDVILPGSLKQAVITGHNGMVPHGAANHISIKLHENKQQIIDLGSDGWFSLLSWAKNHNAIDGIQQNLIISIAAAVGSGMMPNSKQINEGLKILADVKAAGYKFSK